jgi:protein-tyrosine phosphatase
MEVSRMGTHVIKVDRSGDFLSSVRDAAKVLESGGLVVFPTETVYGVGARADWPDAMAKLRDLKGRDVEQGFTVHLGRREEAHQYVPRLPPLAARLIRKGWPGPLTLLVEVAQPEAAPILKGRDKGTREAVYYNGVVGLRCPDDAVAQALLEHVSGPVVASSANLAGRPAPRTGEEALPDLDGRIDVLLDAGRSRHGRSSTIVRITPDSYRMIREGVLDEGIIERMAKVHILFVCTGNTCRSPMAAGLARKLLAERIGCDAGELERHGVHVTSAGIAGGAGPASGGALRVMLQRGIDLSDHSSTALTPSLIQQADHVFVMTRSHREAVLAMTPWAAGKTSLLLESQDVDDPVGLSDDDYNECARVLERGLSKRLQEVSI